MFRESELERQRGFTFCEKQLERREKGRVFPH